jgi:hypothetical protein
MNNRPAIWGIHMGKHVGSRPIDEGVYRDWLEGLG